MQDLHYETLSAGDCRMLQHFVRSRKTSIVVDYSVRIHVAVAVKFAVPISMFGQAPKALWHVPITTILRLAKVDSTVKYFCILPNLASVASLYISSCT